MSTYRLHYFPGSGNSYKLALMLTLGAALPRSRVRTSSRGAAFLRGVSKDEATELEVPRAFSASMESKRGSGFFLTRFLDANRFPLRSKTL